VAPFALQLTRNRAESTADRPPSDSRLAPTRGGTRHRGGAPQPLSMSVRYKWTRVKKFGTDFRVCSYGLSRRSRRVLTRFSRWRSRGPGLARGESTRQTRHTGAASMACQSSGTGSRPTSTPSCLTASDRVCGSAIPPEARAAERLASEDLCDHLLDLIDREAACCGQFADQEPHDGLRRRGRVSRYVHLGEPVLATLSGRHRRFTFGFVCSDRLQPVVQRTG
jgi:hypothetical protein